MKYGELTLGQIEAIVNKLGGLEGVKTLLSGECMTINGPRIFKTWRTVKIGCGAKTYAEYCELIAENGMVACDWKSEHNPYTDVKTLLGDVWNGEAITLPGFVVEPQIIDLELILVSVQELDLELSPTRANIFDRAHELGLVLCPPEVGPVARLCYPEQRKNPRVVIVAMEPVESSDGETRIFNLMMNAKDQPILYADSGSSDGCYGNSQQFIFCRRKML